MTILLAFVAVDGLTVMKQINDEEIEVRKHLKSTPKPLGITSSWGARRYQASFKRLDQRSIDID